jgi:FG-GAP-like repeat
MTVKQRADFDGDGRAEILISSPWGLGILELSGTTLSAPTMQPNGTRLGEWLLNTADNRFGPLGDFDGDGRAEIFVSSPWGIGILEQSGSTFGCPTLAPNGARFGGWLLNTDDNGFGPVGDFDGDGHDEILVTSPWGIGIMKLAGNTMQMLMMAPNGTRFGGWLLNTADNHFGPVGDFDGDGRSEIVVTSPWGIGILELTASNTLQAQMMAPNGTRFGGWLLNTADNHIGAAADYDADGRDELFISSPWGIGIIELSGSSLNSSVMVANNTRIGGWLLNTADNHFGPVGDLDADRRAEILVTSPWGVGILKQAGGTLANPMLAANGTRFGGWLLNTADNVIDMLGDVDGDGRSEVVVTSPWGIGIWKFTGTALTSVMLAPNGTRFGGWLLNTADNTVGIGG